MNKEPLISIIVPAFNCGPFIAKCIENIINQSYPNWELILVDDGSTDNTPTICDEYAQKNNRIKVIHKQNGGLVSARNAGYECATGEWQMYIDGDDWIETDTCEKLIVYLSKYQDIDIVFWKYVQDMGDRSVKSKMGWGCSEMERVYEGDECKELARNVLIYKSGISTAPCKLIRADYAKKHGIFHDNRLKQGAEGVEFSLRAFYYAHKALFVNECFYHYLYNAGSITKQVNETNTRYIADCFSVMEEDIATFKLKEAFTEVLYQRVTYALLAIAMCTYFHPANKDSLSNRLKKYKSVINNTPLFKKSVKCVSLLDMDIFRKVALIFIRMRMYIILQLISWVKQYMLKKGKFDY